MIAIIRHAVLPTRRGSRTLGSRRSCTPSPAEESAREVRNLLRDADPPAVERAERVPGAAGRAGPDRAGRPAGLRLRVGRRASLPGGVLALLGAGGVPGRREPAHAPHPPRTR